MPSVGAPLRHDSMMEYFGSVNPEQFLIKTDQKYLPMLPKLSSTQQLLLINDYAENPAFSIPTKNMPQNQPTKL